MLVLSVYFRRRFLKNTNYFERACLCFNFIVAELCPNYTVSCLHLAADNRHKIPDPLTRDRAKRLCGEIKLSNATNRTAGGASSMLVAIRSLQQHLAVVKFLSQRETTTLIWTGLEVTLRASLWIDVRSNTTLQYTNFDTDDRNVTTASNSTAQTLPMCVLLSKDAAFKWTVRACSMPSGQQALCQTFQGQ